MVRGGSDGDRQSISPAPHYIISLHRNTHKSLISDAREITNTLPNANMYLAKCRAKRVPTLCYAALADAPAPEDARPMLGKQLGEA